MIATAVPLCFALHRKDGLLAMIAMEDGQMTIHGHEHIAW